MSGSESVDMIECETQNQRVTMSDRKNRQIDKFSKVLENVINP